MAFGVEEVEVRQRRVNPVLIVVLVVIALAALGVFVIYPLFFGGEDLVEEAPPIARPAASPSPQPAPSPTQAPTETFEVFESKDPFRPLVNPAGTTGTTPTTGGTTTGGTTPGTTAGATSGAAGAPAPSGGTRVSLLDVFEEGGQQKAQVKVGSTVHTVTPGQTFAGNFKLVSVSGNCATLLHGDDKFTLCEGEEVIK